MRESQFNGSTVYIGYYRKSVTAHRYHLIHLSDCSPIDSSSSFKNLAPRWKMLSIIFMTLKIEVLRTRRSLVILVVPGVLAPAPLLLALRGRRRPPAQPQHVLSVFRLAQRHAHVRGACVGHFFERLLRQRRPQLRMQCMLRELAPERHRISIFLNCRRRARPPYERLRGPLDAAPPFLYCVLGVDFICRVSHFPRFSPWPHVRGRTSPFSISIVRVRFSLGIDCLSLSPRSFRLSVSRLAEYGVV